MVQIRVFKLSTDPTGFKLKSGQSRLVEVGFPQWRRWRSSAWRRWASLTCAGFSRVLKQGCGSGSCWLRIWVNFTRIRHHALIYPDNIWIILTFILKGEKNYQVKIRPDPNPVFSWRLGPDLDLDSLFLFGEKRLLFSISVHFIWNVYKAVLLLF